MGTVEMVEMVERNTGGRHANDLTKAYVKMD